MTDGSAILELKNVRRVFGDVIALAQVTLTLQKNEVHCLLGDNGAGKSTLIKILSGVHQPTQGDYFVDGKGVHFESPKDALNAGIATVYQDLALVPLMSIARNFFLGREPLKKTFGLLSIFDNATAEKVAREKLKELGISIRSANEPVGTLSGGEKQCLAIARAIHFGARVLILDEPTAALGVKQSAHVLRLILRAQQQGVSVIFITHNVQHALEVGNTFTVLNRGQSLGTFSKNQLTRESLTDLMSGKAQLQEALNEANA